MPCFLSILRSLLRTYEVTGNSRTPSIENRIFQLFHDQCAESYTVNWARPTLFRSANTPWAAIYGSRTDFDDTKREDRKSRTSKLWRFRFRKYRALQLLRLSSMVLRSLNFYLLGISALIDRISKEEVTINENLFAGCSKLADFLAQEKYEPVGNETKRQRWKNICRVYDNEGTCRQFLFYSFVFWRYFAPRPITIVWPNIYKRIERSIDDFAVSKSQRFPSRRGRNRTRS